MSEPLRYQCNLLIGGAWWSCIEGYESVLTRMRESAFKFDAESEQPGMSFMEPIELMIGMTLDADTGEKRLVRTAVAPQAIAAVTEIPLDIANEAP
jgi:hypothetical protein